MIVCRRKSSLLGIVLTYIILLFSTFISVFAEGSTELGGNTRLIPPNRAENVVCRWDFLCFMAPNNLWDVFYIYAKPGETITIKDIQIQTDPYSDSSSTNNDGTVNIKYPNGTTSNIDFHISLSSHSINVTTANTPANGGIFEIRINTVSGNEILPGFDFTVKDASGNVKKGRTFSYGFFIQQSVASNSQVIYILTDEGIIFRVDLSKSLPYTAFIASTKKGIYDPATGSPIYHTIKETLLSYFKFAYPSTTNTSIFPDYTMQDSTHKLFFNYPDSDLLNYLGLQTVKDGATVTGLTLNGDSTNHALVGEGGTFNFHLDEIVGSYSLEIDLGNSAKNISHGGIINGQDLSFLWDGKDKQGNIVPAGTYTATLTTAVGETHFLFDDFESSGNGWTFTQMNGRKAGATKVYYDNSQTTIAGYQIPSAIDGVNNSLNGVDSSGGIFHSGTDTYLIDVWMKQDSYSYNLTFTVSEEKKVNVTKVFSDYNDKFNVRPSSVTFDAYIGNSTVSSGSCTAFRTSSWKCTIEKLASDITYTIKERNVNGYTSNTAAAPAGQTQTSVTITNTLLTRNIQVQKIWNDTDNKFFLRPDNVSFAAYIGSSTAPAASCTASAAGNWKCTLNNLAAKDSAGNDMSYTVREISVPDGYTSEAMTNVTGTSVSIQNDLSTINFTVNKIWKDDYNRDNVRPSSICAQLYQDGVPTCFFTELSGETESDTYTFSSIPNVGTYTVTETDTTCENIDTNCLFGCECQ
ncbi:MAG: Cna B-type domain-containing protein [Anaerolineaceae bacterium]|nr:Cna B-type domain-containing protein [Anaerolineaceae bacterium]